MGRPVLLAIMRPLLLAICLVCSLFVGTAAAATNPAPRNNDNEASIPDYAYAGTYTDASAVPEVQRKTTFKLTGKDTITATTWYLTWNGLTRRLVAVYPRFPPTKRLPLVTVFHGAGGRAACNKSFGNAPGAFGFIVACLDGQGVRSRGFSYGAAQNLADNAKMIQLLRQRLPGLRIDPTRLVAAGGSMGGQEALLFGARYPQLAQTIVAIDAPVDMAKRFWHLPRSRQMALFYECEGTPAMRPDCFAARSPLTTASTLAHSTQTLILYWSVNDEISPQEQMPALARAIHAANPSRPFVIRIGNWGHGRSWAPATRNNEWLADAGLTDNGNRADTKYPHGWRIEVDASTDLTDLPSYYPSARSGYHAALR